MLHPESGFHAELGPFLDAKRLSLHCLKRTGSRQVDCNIRSTFDFKGEGANDAATGI